MQRAHHFTGPQVIAGSAALASLFALTVATLFEPESCLPEQGLDVRERLSVFAESVGSLTPEPDVDPFDAVVPQYIEPREPVILPPAGDAPDPCADLRVTVNNLIEENIALHQRIEKLTRQLAETVLERDRARFDETTPYGAFIHGPEAQEIEDPIALARIEDWLRQFPVFLGPGEATWIADRTIERDWSRYGRTSEVALIMFLGQQRLVNELPPERVAQLRAYYADEPGVFP